jgi:2-iminoacetate synthase ThiH
VTSYVPTIEDIEARDGAQEQLHASAHELRRRIFGSRVFIRGVVEVGNYCRQNCHYCGLHEDRVLSAIAGEGLTPSSQSIAGYFQEAAKPQTSSPPAMRAGAVSP